MVHHYPRVTRNGKRSELKEMSQKDLLDRVLAYPDQDLLNNEEDGMRRKYPIGYSADTILKSHDGLDDNNVFPNDKSYHGMVNGYATLTTPEVKVVGVSFRNADLNDMVKDKQQHSKGASSYYHANYRFVPEPENEYDANAIKVEIENQDGTHQHIGYVPKEMAEKYELEGVMESEGTIIDFSNGKLKNVSYRVPLDTEAITIREPEKTYDLEGFNENDLDTLEDDKGLQQ